MACLWLGLAMVCSADEPYGRAQIDETYRDHWAFLPPAQPAVPAVAQLAWVRTPVDAFVAQAFEASGIEPAPTAARRVLLRRAYFDLLGLPPTPAEQADFLADASLDAWPRMIEQLLARPEYGERWGRHWLDVVRYAESNGYERDGAKPHAWRYRDYVIDSFNRDKPFDRFVVEQLAGDELPDANAETQVATTFLRLGPWDDEPADPEVDRFDQLDDVLGTTSAALLGLTLRCARCHDHKFEPFSQRDYARVLAVFSPLKRPQNGRTDLDCLVGTADELASYRQQTAAIDNKVSDCQSQIDQIEEPLLAAWLPAASNELPAEVLEALRTEKGARTDAHRKLLREHAAKLSELARNLAEPAQREQLAALRGEIEHCQAARPAEPPRAYIWMEESPEAPATHVLHRGDPRSPREAVDPGLPAVLVDAAPGSPAPRAHSTGRRLQFAQWVASRQNPLTARVLVNRVWQHHFGEGLVATENDFGLMGSAPSHPELLDWLAVDFMEHGWSIKHLHRLLMTSTVYQLAAKDTESGLAQDPQAVLCWRWRPRRLEAEAIRDALLATSGQLNTQRGGPSVQPKISEAVLAGQSIPGNGWKATAGPEAARRSVYVFVKRTLPLPELEVLDWPGSEHSCEQRQVSTVAPQALTYFNGEFLNAQSKALAQRLQSEAGADVAEQVRLAYRLALAREADAEETSQVLEFLQAQAAQITADRAAAGTPIEAPQAAQAALTSFCVVLLNTNEFAYIE